VEERIKLRAPALWAGVKEDLKLQAGRNNEFLAVHAERGA
jgi:hypothetical protein